LANRPSEKAPANRVSSVSESSNDSSRINGVWKSGSNCYVQCVNDEKPHARIHAEPKTSRKRHRGCDAAGAETGNETNGRRMAGTYQNAVILRVSQLEGCCSDDALQRNRISLTKRMTGNLSWKTTVRPESHQGALRDKTSDEMKRAVSLNKEETSRKTASNQRQPKLKPI